MKVRGNVKKCEGKEVGKEMMAVLGSPISHSLSPKLHNLLNLRESPSIFPRWHESFTTG